VHPAQGGQFEALDAAPGPFVADRFGLVEPDPRFGQGIVEAVADGPDRGERAGVGQRVARRIEVYWLPASL